MITVNSKIILAAAAGVLVGAGGMLAGSMSLRDRDSLPGTHHMANGLMDSDRDMSGVMKGMMQGLSQKTGDAFDQAFLTEMITHHQGALEMALAARTSATHPEIKAMAEAIISAQTKEIEQMKMWQSLWYASTTIPR